MGILLTWSAILPQKSYHFSKSVFTLYPRYDVDALRNASKRSGHEGETEQTQILPNCTTAQMEEVRIKKKREQKQTKNKEKREPTLRKYVIITALKKGVWYSGTFPRKGKGPSTCRKSVSYVMFLWCLRCVHVSVRYMYYRRLLIAEYSQEKEEEWGEMGRKLFVSSPRKMGEDLFNRRDVDFGYKEAPFFSCGKNIGRGRFVACLQGNF